MMSNCLFSWPDEFSFLPSSDGVAFACFRKFVCAVRSCCGDDYPYDASSFSFDDLLWCLKQSFPPNLMRYKHYVIDLFFMRGVDGLIDFMYVIDNPVLFLRDRGYPY